MHKSLFFVCTLLLVLGISSVASATATGSTTRTAQGAGTPKPAQRAARVIPTTSNPTGNGTQAGRIMSNPSFELNDSGCSISASTDWIYVPVTGLRGWATSHPFFSSNCAGANARIIEYKPRNAQDGALNVELNAEYESMLYQSFCLKSGETFSFQFHHRTTGAARTDIVEFRLGIPSGLPAGSTAANSYSRQILRASTTSNGSNLTTSAVNTTYTDTVADAASVTTRSWGRYSGTHTVPATGWDGIFNIGFVAIQGSSATAGNLLDDITLGLQPLVDLGASRDRAATEQAVPTSLKVRINGRVAAGTILVLTVAEGTATPDTDFTIGTVSAGALGTATVAHTAGSTTWQITVPAGDYDGGVVPANNLGGLTIPITYAYDLVAEADEYVKFNLSDPGVGGASSNWAKGDPTCDLSQKNDGVVYTITNVNPTATPTLTPSMTLTPSKTSTRTPTSTPSTQAITFPAIADKMEGGPAFNLAATASSGLPITYTSSTPSVCMVSGNTVTIIGPGDCSIDADQPGGTNAGVTYSAATTVTRTFKVKATQYITFPPISKKLYTDPDLDPGTSASSTLPVTLVSSTPGVCTVVGGDIHYVAPGTCTVTASQPGGVAGGITYAAAADVTRSFPVVGLPQVITYPPIPAKNIYDPAFDLAATADSGLPITYTSLTPEVCTVTGKKVSLFSKGTCTIVASQPGGTIDGKIYAAATSVTRSFPVSDDTPTPSKTNLPTATITNTPTNTRTHTPTPIPNLLKKAAVGSSFVLGLLQNGTLITWGMNKEYQTNLPPCCGSGVSDIAVGTNFALALKNGRVYAWGANTRGQLKIPTNALSRVTAVAAGYAHGLALRADGSVVCWGNDFYKQCNIPPKLTGVKGMAGGTDHTLLILKDGTVKGFGRNQSGQISIPPNVGKVIAVSAGCDHSMAIRANNTAAAWGANTYLQSRVPLNLSDVKSIAAGCHFSLAMMHDGTLFGWGRNDLNQISLPTGITNAFSIGAGYANSIIGRRDGSIVAIGAPEHGALVTRTHTPVIDR